MSILREEACNAKLYCLKISFKSFLYHAVSWCGAFSSLQKLTITQSHFGLNQTEAANISKERKSPRAGKNYQVLKKLRKLFSCTEKP